jgi:23S rRNA (cytosine1962-C5)-methyltransferase
LKSQSTNLVVFEDEHLLVADKPAGWNTHAPSPFAGEGLYEWLKNSHPSRANLAIIHRLDKETSGLIVFGKDAPANRSLSLQFEDRTVRKKYLLLTDRKIAGTDWVVRSAMVRSGEKYLSRPLHAGAGPAETRFHNAGRASHGDKSMGGCSVIEAEPITGRTHQIRVHAAERGFPVLGDTLYGGTPAARLYLHAAQLSFRHPVTHQTASFESTPDFSADARATLRGAVIDASLTDAYRVAHGAADGWPELYVDRLGEFLLAQSPAAPTRAQRDFLEGCRRQYGARGIYHKMLRRQPWQAGLEDASPKWLAGETAPGEIVVRENGVRFALRLDAGYSAGLFLDQRDNRRRLLTGYVAPKLVLESPQQVLNAFAYTCGFSVCAALSGARVTSLDLSKKYLARGKANFVLNGLRPQDHDFIFGDAFEWMRRLAGQRRLFDVILLDPPTFSRSKERGVFQAEKHYEMLLDAALPLLRPQGILFASSNAAGLTPEHFLDAVTRAAAQARRGIVRRHYAPQPPDFPITRAEPAYLKTVWLRVS